MPRFQGRLDCDTPYSDGWSFRVMRATDAASGTVTWTQTAFGNQYLNIGNSQTVVLAISIDSLIARSGVQDDLQLQFGAGGLNGSQAPFGANGLPVNNFTTSSTASVGASSGPVNIAVVSSAGFSVGNIVSLGTNSTKEYQPITAIPDATHITVESTVFAHTTPFSIVQNPFTTPASVSGRPPFTGISSLIQPTSPRAKGVKLTAIYPVYQITGAALTTNTIGIAATTFANNTAPAITPVLSVAANGLATAVQAQPYVTPIIIPTPSFVTTKQTDIELQWNITTGASGTAQIYGIFGDVTYNYN